MEAREAQELVIQGLLWKELTSAQKTGEKEDAIRVDH